MTSNEENKEYLELMDDAFLRISDINSGFERIKQFYKLSNEYEEKNRILFDVGKMFTKMLAEVKEHEIPVKSKKRFLQLLSKVNARIIKEFRNPTYDPKSFSLSCFVKIQNLKYWYYGKTGKKING